MIDVGMYSETSALPARISETFAVSIIESCSPRPGARNSKSHLPLYCTLSVVQCYLITTTIIILYPRAP